MFLAMEGIFEQRPTIKRWSLSGKEKASLQGTMLIQSEDEKGLIQIKVSATDEVAKQIERLYGVSGQKMQFIAEPDDVQCNLLSLRICCVDPSDTLIQKQDRLLMSYIES